MLRYFLASTRSSFSSLYSGGNGRQRKARLIVIYNYNITVCLVCIRNAMLNQLAFDFNETARTPDYYYYYYCYLLVYVGRVLLLLLLLYLL